jgi:hypothetical protein
VGEKKVRYMLRAVIYSGDSHFTSQVIKPDGSVWYHDGIEIGTHSEAQGSIHKADVRFLNLSVWGEVRKTAASVIYGREDE